MYHKSHTEGDDAEKRFLSFLDSNKIEHKGQISDKKIQIKDHIDCFFKLGEKFHSVDIKSKKRISRSDANHEEIVWLEFRNVSGNLGWLLGEANYIAFEKENSFILIFRKSLVDWAIKNIELGQTVNSSKQAYKKLYSRKDRNDLITYVNLKDIGHLVEIEIGNGFLKYT
jgi:hypothetical protein